jgi:hypothetical protein
MASLIITLIRERSDQKCLMGKGSHFSSSGGKALASNSTMAGLCKSGDARPD